MSMRWSRRWASAAALLAVSGNLAQAAEPLKFVFGSGVAGARQVAPGEGYTKEKGFGFEIGADVKVAGGAAGGGAGGVARGVAGGGAMGVVGGAGGVFSADKPFYFSAAVPEGNHRVTLTVGSPQGPTDLTVKSELRRLMVEKIHVEAGRSEKVSFVVNVRTPNFEGGAVRLKAPRETVDEAWAWDEKLTLEFNGARPNLQSIEIEKVDVPTVYLLGDSTVCDQSKEPWNSWGQMFTRFFKEDVAIANHAQSGESVASSLGARRFDKVFAQMKPGDYLFVQFGHNDMKDTKPGALETFKANYKSIIEKTRAKGGTPVIVSSMERKSGVTNNTLQAYPAAAKEVARANGAAFIDLHAMSQQLYQGLGDDLNSAFQDGTHHNNFGSYLISKLVLEGVRQNNLDLAKHIRAGVPAFDPSKPDKAADFAVPASPAFSMQRPLGD